VLDKHFVIAFLIRIYLFFSDLFIDTDHCIVNRFRGEMVSVLTSNVTDRRFAPWSGQTKDYKIGICCVPKNWLVRIKIMCVTRGLLW